MFMYVIEEQGSVCLVVFGGCLFIVLFVVLCVLLLCWVDVLIMLVDECVVLFGYVDSNVCFVCEYLLQDVVVVVCFFLLVLLLYVYGELVDVDVCVVIVNDLFQ